MTLALLTLGAILWGLAYLLAESRLGLQLYRPPLGNNPAHAFAACLAEMGAAGDAGTVALLGPSTVREGFDPDEMHRVAPDLRFFNCGVTSQGSIMHAEMLLDIIKRFDVHPEVLVLGLNSRQLAARQNLLGRTGFVDLLDTSDLMALLHWEPTWQRSDTRAQVRANLWWPLNRLGTRFDAVLRYGIYRAYRFVFGDSAQGEKAFLRGGGRLGPPTTYLYRETEHSPAAFQQMLEGTRSRGLLVQKRHGDIW